MCEVRYETKSNDNSGTEILLRTLAEWDPAKNLRSICDGSRNKLGPDAPMVG